MKAYIYGIKNLINNKLYIGSTKSFTTRKYFHFYQLKQGIHHSYHLQQSYNKNGKSNFLFYLIEECNVIDRKAREIYHININNAANKDFGYNVYEPNGDKFICSEETKTNIRNSKHHKELAIAIDMYDLCGNFIKSFVSIAICAKEYNIKSGIINEIISTKRKSYKGYTYVLKGTPFIYIPSTKQRNMSSYYK